MLTGVEVGGVERKGREGLQESMGKLGIERCDQCLDCGDGFTTAYVYETSLVVYFKSIVSSMSVHQ